MARRAAIIIGQTFRKKANKASKEETLFMQYDFQPS